MKENLGPKITRRRYDQIPPRSSERLAELEAMRDEDIDASDIPEFPGGERLRRDQFGNLVKRQNFIREAVVEAMNSRGMTSYALWKSARDYCPTITETAVGQFAKGQRSIGIEYLEAILNVLDLTIIKKSREGESIGQGDAQPTSSLRSSGNTMKG